MAMLIVTDDGDRRDALLAAAGAHAYADRAAPVAWGCDRSGVMAAVRAHRPTGAVIEAPTGAALDAVLARLQAASAWPVPVVAVLPQTAAALAAQREVTQRAATAGEEQRGAITIVTRAEPPAAVIASLALLQADAASPRIGGYDRTSQTLHGAAGTVPLTPLEGQALELLLDRPGRVVATVDLCTALWGRGDQTIPVDAHLRATLRSHVYALRRKLQRADVPLAIETRRGLGYVVRSVGPVPQP